MSAPAAGEDLASRAARVVTRRKRIELCAPAVVAIAMLLRARSAEGAEIRVERSRGAEACPDPVKFEARARESATSASRDVSIRFARTSTGYASSIRTSDGMSRALEDDACDALADATLVVVRLALDVESASVAPTSSKPTPAPAPAQATTETPAPDRDRDHESPPAANLGRANGFELLAGGAVAAGFGASFGARAGAGWVFAGRRLSIGVTGLALVPETRAVENGSVEIGLLGGGLEGCGRAATSSRALAGALCARGEVFRLSGSAGGFARNEAHGRPLATMGLALRGKLRIARPFGLFAEVAASVPLARERFAIDGVGIVYAPPVVAGTAATGLFVDFE